MSLLGKSGMRRLAEVNLSRAHEAWERLTSQPQLEGCFSGAFFNEFVLRARNLQRLLQRCTDARIVPGVPLGQWYPELKDCLLVCVTEMNEREEIEHLVRVIGD
jgi:glycine dehydrogenase subunit 1